MEKQINVVRTEIKLKEDTLFTPKAPFFIKTDGVIMNDNDLIVKIKLSNEIAMLKPFTILGDTLNSSNELTLIVMYHGESDVIVKKGTIIGTCYYMNGVTFRTPKINTTNKKETPETKKEEISIDIK